MMQNRTTPRPPLSVVTLHSLGKVETRGYDLYPSQQLWKSLIREDPKKDFNSRTRVMCPHVESRIYLAALLFLLRLHQHRFGRSPRKYTTCELSVQ